MSQNSVLCYNQDSFFASSWSFSTLSVSSNHVGNYFILLYFIATLRENIYKDFCEKKSLKYNHRGNEIIHKIQQVWIPCNWNLLCSCDWATLNGIVLGSGWLGLREEGYADEGRRRMRAIPIPRKSQKPSCPSIK